jgi:hypothetical protein
MVHPRRGVPIIDCHNCVFSGEGRRVALVRDLIDFHASGERPRGNEILHHVVVSELVLDEVGMVWVSLLKELLEVVHGQSCLMLAAVCDSHGVRHVQVSYLLINAAIGGGCSCSLLEALLAPLVAALGVLDDDVRRHFPAAAFWVKLAHFAADSSLGGDAA